MTVTKLLNYKPKFWKTFQSRGRWIMLRGSLTTREKLRGKNWKLFSIRMIWWIDQNAEKLIAVQSDTIINNVTIIMLVADYRLSSDYLHLSVKTSDYLHSALSIICFLFNYFKSSKCFLIHLDATHTGDSAPQHWPCRVFRLALRSSTFICERIVLRPGVGSQM